MAKQETKFKASLVQELLKLFPGAIVLPGDANHTQGIPDLIMLWKDTWAALEVKASPTATTRPNQPYYVDLMDAMSFAAFIDPLNKQEVLSALQLAFRTRRPARVSQRQQASLDKLRQREASGSMAQLPSSKTRNRTTRASA